MSYRNEAWGMTEARLGQWPHSAPDQALPSEVRDLLDMAFANAVIDDDRSALQAREAVDTARSMGDEGTIARTLLHAARVLRMAGRVNLAYLSCIEAQALFERRDDRRRATHALLLRGECWTDVDEHDRALRAIGVAAERFRLADNGSDFAHALSALASAHARAGQAGEALACSERAVDLLSVQGTTDGSHAARALGDVGALWLCSVAAQLHLDEFAAQRVSGKPLEARAHLDRAAGLLAAFGDANLSQHAVTDDCRQQLATPLVLLAVHCPGDARFAKMVRQLSRAPSSSCTRALIRLQLALTHLERGHVAKATSSARAAVRHCGQAPVQSRRPQVWLLLGDLLEREGDARGAYECLDIALQVEITQQREAIAMRAEMLALEHGAEKELFDNELTFAYAQRLSNVGHLVASVNHELNQPLASLRIESATALELIEQGRRTQARESMELMLRLATRVKDLAARLAAFPDTSAAVLRPVRLRHAVDEALAMMRSHLDKVSCEVVVALDEGWALAEESQLVRVIANLAHNALDAQHAVASPSIEFMCRTYPDSVVLSISDNGPGISPAVRERLFQPFVSSKPAGKGLGLGLALSRDVVREMGGDLSLRQHGGTGAIFDLTLRRAPLPERS